MAELPCPAPERVPFCGPDGLPLELRRMANSEAPPVLLLHGASAQHQTFCIPRGGSLSEHLWEAGYEPWLLDWRGSRRVTDELQRSGKLSDSRDLLDFDQAAEKDVAATIERIAQVRDCEDVTHEIKRHKVHVVAHCMGAGVLAQAIALDHVPLDRLGRVVLFTLGLFYETPIDGKVKSQFHVLDRLWRSGKCSVIDPRKPDDQNKWPEALQEVYQGIGAGWRPHPLGDRELRSSHALCNRLSFMYGTPYWHENLVDGIHGAARVRFVDSELEPRKGERLCAVARKKDADGEKRQMNLDARLVNHEGLGFVSEVEFDDESGPWRRRQAKGVIKLSGSVGKYPKGERDLWADDKRVATCNGKVSHDEPAELGKQFGAIPLRMYLQGAQNVRRRWAGPFVEAAEASDDAKRDTSYIGSEALERFRSLPAVTLITGAQNQLWHPDSIHRMYEWLTRGLRPERKANFRKRVLSQYGHQDLLWGANAKAEVFELVVKEGLGGDGQAIEFIPAEPPGRHLAGDE